MLAHDKPATQAPLPPIVLLVEDDPDTRELYETALGLSGLWVANARDVDDAIDYAVDLRPDVIIMDIDLPRPIDGITLARELREQSRLTNTPIVAVTGLDRSMFEADATLFSEVLSKPVHLDLLVRRVMWLTARAAVLREESERTRVPDLIRRSDDSITSEGRLTDSLNSTPWQARTCPQCRGALRFTERRQLEGVLFDYYTPCRAGCGLFCYDHSRRKLIALIE